MAVEGLKVAVFIDAENVSVALAAEVFRATQNLGDVVERRAYGDFSSPHLKPWRDAAPVHALDLVQTVVGAAGKNSADIALAIDCIELLGNGRADIYCLVTSDSDFTQVAMRVRARGKTAVGIGRATASGVYRSALSRYIQIGNEKAAAPAKAAPKPAAPQLETADARKLMAIVRSAFETVEKDGDGWSKLNLLSNAMRAIGFTPKDFGRRQIGKVLQGCQHLEMRNPNSAHWQVRLRPLKSVDAA